MLNNLEYCEFVADYREGKAVSEDLIASAVRECDKPLFQLLVWCPYVSRAGITIAEQLKYNLEVVETIAKVSGEILTEKELKLCSMFLMGEQGGQESISLFESVINIDVPENHWLWLIREHVRYSLLNIYISNTQETKKIREMVALLQPNKEYFEQTWSAERGNARKLLFANSL